MEIETLFKILFVFVIFYGIYYTIMLSNIKKMYKKKIEDLEKGINEIEVDLKKLTIERLKYFKLNQELQSKIDELNKD